MFVPYLRNYKTTHNQYKLRISNLNTILKSYNILFEKRLSIIGEKDKSKDKAIFLKWLIATIFQFFSSSDNKRFHFQEQLDVQAFLVSDKSSATCYEFTAERHLHIKEITEAIKDLDNDYKIPFVLVLSGYTCQEIADRLDLSMEATENRIFMARSLLEINLKKHI